MRFAITLVAAGLLVGMGLTHGLILGRWGASARVAEAAEQLAALPNELGQWSSEPLPINPKQLEIAEVAGHISRRYVHPPTGTQVSVLAICGMPGPISVHPPDVCYRGAGYQIGAKELLDLPEGGKCWTALFIKPGPTPDILRIYWAWSDSDAWTAPEDPRFDYAGADYLCKVYVVRRQATDNEEILPTPYENFLSGFFEQVRLVLPPTD